MAHDPAQLTAPIMERVISLQRTIHADPEIGFDTIRTAALAAAELREAGLTVREQIGKTGVVADLEVPGASTRIAFRADMDALPMEEENDLPHRSKNPGAAHLCGHDAHTSMLLGAAHVLAKMPEALRCNLRFIFQPNEEALPGGAPAMIKDGCLEGVDRIFGMHVWPLLPTGTMGVHEGATMAQPDCFAIHVKGVGGHAATPHKTRDPILCAAQIVTNLQGIVARSVDPIDSAVVSVTQFHAGSADNVIAPVAELRGTVRTFRQEVGDLVRQRVQEVAIHTARAAGLEAEVEMILGYPVVMNDAACCDEAERSLTNHIPVSRDVEACLGGEDFAYYQEHIPGAFLFLGNYDEDQGIVHFCHHPQFRVDDNAMQHGVKSWIGLALGAG